MAVKILVAYYSWSGNTKKIAEDIRRITGGELCEIIPVVPYSSNYSEVVEQGKKEIRYGKRPLIEGAVSDVSDYDVIFIGSPNWWSTLAPPVQSFLEQHDFTGKVVVPFCTHGGGGKSRMIMAVEEACKGAVIKDELVVYNRGNGNMPEQIAAWINSLGI